jgi:hypothetical protein
MKDFGSEFSALAAPLINLMAEARRELTPLLDNPKKIIGVLEDMDEAQFQAFLVLFADMIAAADFEDLTKMAAEKRRKQAIMATYNKIQERKCEG